MCDYGLFWWHVLSQVEPNLSYSYLFLDLALNSIEITDSLFSEVDLATTGDGHLLTHLVIYNMLIDYIFVLRRLI